jgi:dTDP-4-dehydrorhamnose reductase
VGGRLASLLAHSFDVMAGVRHSPAPEGLRRVAFDLLEADSFAAVLDAAEPDAVIHCAALADPDRCEREPSLAEQFNVDAPRRLARLCRQRGVRVVALSTDLVFDGERSFVTENDAPRPLLAYGRTKLAGEDAVLSEAPGSAIVRVALVVGRGHGARGTASEATAWALSDRRPLRLYADQHRTPVDPESLADAIARLLHGGQSGRYHLGGPERVSRHELGLRVASALGLPSEMITPVSQSELPPAAPRPADVSLDSSRARRELGWEPRPLQAAMLEGRPKRG